MEDSLRAHAEQRVGSVIKGKYRIDRVLGMGGMAVVYAATHTRNGAELAIKMLHPELSIRDDIRQRFLREGYAANSVKHSGVVKVVDDDTSEDNAAFIVMEMLAGAPVDTLTDRNGGKLPIRAAIAIVDQLLDVLRAAHEKGIVHRDIKPANVFVTTDGTVKVLDFGIARVRDALASSGVQQTGSGVLMGTPAYMSPEQALAKSSEIDGQSDVWAAGATLYALISGRFVHEAENGPQMLILAATRRAPSISTVAGGVPAPIVDVIAKALAFEKASRFASAAEMRQALREASVAAFGSPPQREALEGLFAETVDAARTEYATPPSAPPRGTGAPDVQPSHTIPLVAAAATPTPQKQSGGTAAPVATDASPREQRGSRFPLYLGGALAAIALVGLGALLATSGKRGPADAPAIATQTLPTLPAATTATLTPIASSAAAPSASVAPTLSAIPTAVHSAKPSIAQLTTSKPTATTAAPSAPPAKPKVDCTDPYTYDQNGKHPKPECL